MRPKKGPRGTAPGCRFSGFNDTSSRTTATEATAWLLGEQQLDGSFEVAAFPGFETPDAVLAIAENAQTQFLWNAGQALSAVKSVVRNTHTPLHALDDFADGSINAGQAAKLIVLDVVPLGLNPRSFNPDGDASRDLVATLDGGAQPDGSYGAFNATLFGAIAKRLVSGSVPARTLAFVRSAQQANGGWSFSGSPSSASPPRASTPTSRVGGTRSHPGSPTIRTRPRSRGCGPGRPPTATSSARTTPSRRSTPLRRVRASRRSGAVRSR